MHLFGACDDDLIYFGAYVKANFTAYLCLIGINV